MRTEFVQTDSRKAAVAHCPWATRIIKVEGGYYCFESVTDFTTWRSQK